MVVMHWLRAALSTLLLLVLYVLVIVPVGLASQLLRSDPLQRRFDADATSYWEPRTEVSTSLLTHLRLQEKLWLVPVVLILLGVGLMLLVSEAGLALSFIYPLF